MSKQVTGFTIAYGKGTITVSDTSKPTWFGDYHGGKLAIYIATLDLDEDTELSDTVTMVCVYYDANGTDFVMSSHYVSSNSIDDIISDLQARVIIAYTREVSKRLPPSTYVPGPDTLQ